MDKPEKYSLYKANKSKNGSAIQLDINKDRKAVFLECTNQKEEQRFDWGNKITVKLSTVDMGKILSVLNGGLNSTKLFHDPGKGDYESSKNIRNTVVNLEKTGQGFMFAISQKTEKGVNKVNVGVSPDEAEIIKLLLQRAVVAIYSW